MGLEQNLKKYSRTGVVVLHKSPAGGEIRTLHFRRGGGERAHMCFWLLWELAGGCVYRERACNFPDLQHGESNVSKERGGLISATGAAFE